MGTTISSSSAGTGCVTNAATAATPEYTFVMRRERVSIAADDTRRSAEGSAATRVAQPRASASGLDERREPLADARGLETGASMLRNLRRPRADVRGMTAPQAYFVTFGIHGAHLHGDDRGSYQRAARSRAPVAPNPAWRYAEQQQLAYPATPFDAEACRTIESAIREVCAHRRWSLIAVQARPTHVHVVFHCPGRPEHAMNAFKAWSTRALREAGYPADRRPWARHGSTRYLWDGIDVEAAALYVAEGQGAPVRWDGTTPFPGAPPVTQPRASASGLDRRREPLAGARGCVTDGESGDTDDDETEGHK